jgi:hypothetical protein
MFPILYSYQRKLVVNALVARTDIQAQIEGTHG